MFETHCMGLLYLYPQDLEDPDHIIKNADSVTLRTYGLPPIFWLYLLGTLTLLGLLSFSVSGPVIKILELGDPIGAVIAYSLIFFLLVTVTTLVGFFFYEKNLILEKTKLSVRSKAFGIPLTKKSYLLNNPNQIEIIHYLSSPNMARIQNGQDMKGFQNKGYWELRLNLDNKNSILIDGDPENDNGLLLQIFTKTCIGPVFFEIIQRMSMVLGKSHL